MKIEFNQAIRRRTRILIIIMIIMIIIKDIGERERELTFDYFVYLLQMEALTIKLT